MQPIVLVLRGDAQKNLLAFTTGKLFQESPRFGFYRRHAHHSDNKQNPDQATEPQIASAKGNSNEQRERGSLPLIFRVRQKSEYF